MKVIKINGESETRVVRRPLNFIYQFEKARRLHSSILEITQRSLLLEKQPCQSAVRAHTLGTIVPIPGRLIAEAVGAHSRATLIS